MDTFFDEAYLKQYLGARAQQLVAGLNIRESALLLCVEPTRGQTFVVSALCVGPRCWWLQGLSWMKSWQNQKLMT